MKVNYGEDEEDNEDIDIIDTGIHQLCHLIVQFHD
jgi:hypothetical protein